MKERWFSFSGYAVFDHETKRFWHRNEIKELAQLFWDDCEMDTVKKKPDNSDLKWIFEEEFPQYLESGGDMFYNRYWDDCGRWEIVEIPYNVGFGILWGQEKRFHELVQEYKHRGDKE